MTIDQRAAAAPADAANEGAEPAAKGIGLCTSTSARCC